VFSGVDVSRSLCVCFDKKSLKILLDLCIMGYS
jgi:hypothetical protein